MLAKALDAYSFSQRARRQQLKGLPMDLARILKQAQSDGVNRCVAPPLVEETPRAIQMLEILFINFTPPEFHICNLEITPEMTCRIPIRLIIMLWPSLAIRQPLLGVVFDFILRVRGQKLLRLRPQRGYRLRRIVQINRKPVGFVVVFHVAEDVIVDVAKEVDFRLDAPVVADVGQRGVVVEHAGVPAAHLVVGDFAGVLDVLLFEHFGGFFKEVVVDEGGDVPVLFGD